MPGNQGSLGQLFARFSTQISQLFRAEVALVRVQAKAAVQRFAVAAVLLVTALVLALFMLGWLIHAMFFAWLLVIPHEWAAALLTAAVLAGLALILGLAGYAALKKAQRHLPAPAQSVKTDVGIIKSALKGTTEGDTHE